jgi:hypothetical protein
MTSLENRLQDTEAALFTTLHALETQGNGDLSSLSFNSNGNVNCAMSPRPSRSKLEKQNEWRQQPLQKSEDLIAWFEERRKVTPNRLAAPESSRDLAREPSNTSLMPRLNSESAHGHAHLPPDAPPLDVAERLSSCSRPTVPNGFSSTAKPTAWLDCYF